MSTPDWLVLLAYLLVVVAIGWWSGRRHAGGDEFFLAGRSMPVWAVAVSVLATSLSAATFIGGPEQAYRTNLTYLSTQIGGLIAILIVARFFLPVYYRHGVTSVYELLGHEYGAPARRAASAMFMLGRLLASGARLFMVAIPFALITFGHLETPALVAAIVIIASVATVYTLLGGVRAVIWTDVLQAVVLVATVSVAVFVLLGKIPLSGRELFESLAATPVGDTSKLTVIDLDPAWSKPYTIWTAVFGWSLFLLAAYGVDQDLVQRMLTCRTPRQGSRAAIMSIVIGWPVVALFLGLGLLLHVFYARPDLMGEAAPAYAIDDTRKVFLEFILAELGPGLRGLMIAGLFAAAMSSLDSVLNALAATTIADFYRPWRNPGEREERRASRFAVAAWAVLLSIFACGCVSWQKASGQTLIDFALGVMVFAYTGLLGVYVAALFTRRGNAASVIAALAAGFACTIALRTWTPLAMPWQMVIGTGLSLVVCCAGRRSQRTADS